MITAFLLEIRAGDPQLGNRNLMLRRKGPRDIGICQTINQILSDKAQNSELSPALRKLQTLVIREIHEADPLRLIGPFLPAAVLIGDVTPTLRCRKFGIFEVPGDSDQLKARRIHPIDIAVVVEIEHPIRAQIGELLDILLQNLIALRKRQEKVLHHGVLGVVIGIIENPAAPLVTAAVKIAVDEEVDIPVILDPEDLDPMRLIARAERLVLLGEI